MTTRIDSRNFEDTNNTNVQMPAKRSKIAELVQKALNFIFEEKPKESLEESSKLKSEATLPHPLFNGIVDKNGKVIGKPKTLDEWSYRRVLIDEVSEDEVEDFIADIFPFKGAYHANLAARVTNTQKYDEGKDAPIFNTF